MKGPGKHYVVVGEISRSDWKRHRASMMANFGLWKGLVGGGRGGRVLSLSWGGPGFSKLGAWGIVHDHTFSVAVPSLALNFDDISYD